MNRLFDRNFLLAMACQTLFVTANALMAHYNRWIEFLGGDLRQAGWIMGLGPILGLCLRPWVGQWINRLGAKNVWSLGYLLFGVGVVGNLAYAGFGALYFYRAAIVLGAALVFTSSLTYITLAVAPGRRTEAIGLLGAGGFIGMLIGPTLGDLILGSPPRGADDFTRLFLVALAFLFLPLVGVPFLRPTPRSARPATAGLSDFLATARQYWPGTVLCNNLAFGLCMAVPFVFLASYVDQYQIQAGSLPAVSVFFWAYAGWGIVVRIGSARWADRWCRRRVLIWGMVLMGSGMFSYLLVPPGPGYMILIPGLLCGTAHAIIFHTMISLSLEPFADEVRGTGSALSLMAQDLGMIAGAPILGQIAASAGFAWMFVTVGASCFAVATIYGGRSYWLARQQSELEVGDDQLTCAVNSQPAAGVPGERVAV